MKNRLFIIMFICIALTQLVYGDLIWHEDFEIPSQWQLTGEFEIDAPQGLGGNYGNPDPTSAFNGTKCLGTDLTGLGSNPGDYEASLGDRAYKAISPVIDCSEFYNINVSFYKYINVEQQSYDHAYFEISVDNGATWIVLWSNDATITDSDWSEMTYNLSQYADQQSSLQLRYSIGSTDASWFYSGWNVDDITISGDPAVFATIMGYVRDVDTNEGLENASVIAGSYTTTTNDDGYYTLIVPAGTHNVAYHCQNYFEAIESNITVTENQELNLDVNLTPCSPPTDLVAEVINDADVQLNWTAPQNQLQPVIGYNILRNDVLVESVFDTSYMDVNLFNGSYIYQVNAIYMYGNSLPTNNVEVEITGHTSLDPALLEMDNDEVICFPNPFDTALHQGINIAYSLSYSGFTEISIYNIKGQKVCSLFNGDRSVGTHSLVWNGKDDAGKLVSEGVYFSRIRRGNEVSSSKIILLR